MESKTFSGPVTGPQAVRIERIARVLWYEAMNDGLPIGWEDAILIASETVAFMDRSHRNYERGS